LGMPVFSLLPSMTSLDEVPTFYYWIGSVSNAKKGFRGEVGMEDTTKRS